MMIKQIISKIDELKPNTCCIVGIPFDANSSFLRGSALGPARFREIFYSDSSNLCSEDGLNLGVNKLWADLGDINIVDTVGVFNKIVNTQRTILDAECRSLSIGGDHSITYPILKAYSEKYKKITILHLDAHSDLYDVYDGNRLSHACPFARIMEDNLAERLIQVGIRTTTPELKLQADKFRVEIIDMINWNSTDNITLEGPVYLSLDLDVLDPSFAPGVSHQEPGGLTTRDVIKIIQSIKPKILGADIVEFNPIRDPVGITGMVTAKLAKEILARMIQN